MDKISVICIVGPTASGKTSLSVELAKKFNAEIVSADSMQIYKGMNIATAKPTEEEMQGVVHHLMGFLEPTESFSVARYVELAHKIISEIYARNKTVMIVGGTGLYVDSLLKNVDFNDQSYDENLRSELFSIAEEKGTDYMLSMLSQFDEAAAQKLSQERNLKRIIRAIEVYKLTGVTFTKQNEIALSKGSPYKAVKIGLTADSRRFLYDRINQRVEKMLDMGLLQEAKDVLGSNLSQTSVKAIGYKELIPYFSNEKTLDECIQKLKMETRRYAKRQLTWFRRDESINWFNIDELSSEELLSKCSKLLESEGFKVYG